MGFRFQRLLATLVLIAFSTTFAGCALDKPKFGTTTTGVNAVTSVTLSRTSLSLERGDVWVLSATTYPAGASGSTITWSTTNATIASVTSTGTVTAVSTGSATITARAASGASANCYVTVSYGVGDFTVSESESNNTFGTAKSITVNGTTVTGSNASKYDADYFKVYLTSGTTIGFILAPQYSLDASYYLIGIMNASETVLDAGTRDGETVSMQYTIASTGYYYLVIMYDDDSPYSDGDSYTAFIWWE